MRSVPAEISRYIIDGTGLPEHYCRGHRTMEDRIMSFNAVSRWTAGLTAVAVFVTICSTASAARRSRSPIKPTGEVVEMFAAMKSGEIEVTLIPKDATVSTVIFKNKTDRPLSIKLPAAFAGVPVSAQFGGGGAFGHVSVAEGAA